MFINIKNGNEKKKKDWENKKKFPGKPLNSVKKKVDLVTYVDTNKLEKESKNEIFSRESFEDLKLHKFLLSTLSKVFSFHHPTHVQQKTIPSILNGENICVQSDTGSGKTMAYALAVIHLLQEIRPKLSRTNGPNVLILVPTHELAIQTYKIVSELLKSFINIVSTYLVGGEKKKAEKARLRKGINIIIGTPGRIDDHLENTDRLGFGEQFKHLILDESDRLLSKSFKPIIYRIKERIDNDISNVETAKYKIILLSATINEDVEEFMTKTKVQFKKIENSRKPKSFLRTCSTDDADDYSKNNYQIPSTLSQYIVPCSFSKRLTTLITLIHSICYNNLSKIFNRSNEKEEKEKILIFLSTNASAEYHKNLFDILLKNNLKLFNDQIDLLSLYGNLVQLERKKVIGEFEKKNRTSILFTTDVASRGLDFHNLKWIIQYNPPGDPIDYIHRVGRTARVGRHGNAILFLATSPTNEMDFINQMEKKYEGNTSKFEKILPKQLSLSFYDYVLNNQPLIVGEIMKLKRKDNSDTEIIDCYSLMDQFQLFLQTNIDKTIALKQQGREAYVTSVRAYATYSKELKNIFNIQHLYMGAFAKGFCLLERPIKINQQNRQDELRKRKAERSNNKTTISNDSKYDGEKSKRKKSFLNYSEFDNNYYYDSSILNREIY
ncbi:hypothetical protein SNEBB_006905 [Seison nebaliae]|nr:hypothetical protein SNEBB_006905 [Seison nebaliae]